MESKVPILLYHDLESPDFPNEKKNLATRNTVVNAHDFEDQLEYLSKNGYKTLSIEEYFNYRYNKKSIASKSIIITFDDGHFSNYYIAFPILQKYGFSATFFIVSDKVDSKNHLRLEQINKMVDEGMEIGSHGLTHTYLPLMSNEEIEYELRQSKENLENIIKHPVDYFAFPGGHYNQHVLKLLSLCGYNGACSCHQGLNDMNTSPYLLKRIEIRKNVSINEFEKIFQPANIGFYQLVDLCKFFFRKAIGLKAYE